MIIIIRKQNIFMQVRSSEKRNETKHLLLPRAHLNKTSKVEYSDKILRNCVFVEMRNKCSVLRRQHEVCCPGLIFLDISRKLSPAITCPLEHPWPGPAARLGAARAAE